ncbi:MAG TPA: metallophosphoesterase family protein [Ktedonobacterales bacterium]|nr:metallophosphoesterase family protein [Ktedonobacterales bacterium]
MADQRIGIFSDMHGNAVAFDAVLAALRAEGIERFVCLGDVAATGPQPREVVQRLRDLHCPVVMGNTDDHVLTPPAPDSDDENTIRIREIDQWSAAQLSADERAFVASFAPTVTLPLADGGSLLGYHGSPHSYNDILLPTTPTEELDALLGGVTTTVLAGGHTHQQMLRRHHQALMVNPGSVGLPMDRVPPGPGTRNPAWAEFAVLTCGEGDLRIELRRVRFDVVALLAAARASGMPHAEWYASDWDIG